MPFAQVALPLPVRHAFAYRVPDELASRVRAGTQVLVPFRGRSRRGIVVSVSASLPEIPASVPHEIRSIASVLEDTPLTPHLLALGSWIADYYLAPIGEVLVAALPGGLEGFARSRARRDAKEEPAMRLALPDRVSLTAGQRDAIAALTQAFQRGGFAAFLVHGVTASGKTEVYLRAAQEARERGRQTLLLVPEVALSAQLVDEFRRRFGGRVGVLHSYLTIGERRRNWELASRGGLDVVVGARSAVFAPLGRLGLIVVDEEHEPAYKQSERLRYHGRDTAVRRAQMLGIPVMLGSATPSLESLANAARGKYVRLGLPGRVDRRPLPRMHVVDMRRAGTGSGLLSPTLRAAIAVRLERREQVMLFLNRRGHSHHTQCRACGYVPECPYCDIALTLHLDPREWRCHYCEHREPATAQCPKCRAALLRYGGGGTQRAERELRAAFASARIVRLDTDVSRRRGAAREAVSAFRRGDADVLIGTQMIAKGFDFPRVTLVGVLDADVGLHLPDFRAAERTYQLLVQVSGRSGRGRAAGEVYVQTCTPEHPAIAAAVLHDENAFVEHELEQRREAEYPPYVRLVALLFSGKREGEVERAASDLATFLRADPEVEGADPGDAAAGEAPDPGGVGVRVLGPAPHVLTRLRGQYRWHLLLKGARASDLRAAAARAIERWESAPGRHGVRMVVDVDPVDVL